VLFKSAGVGLDPIQAWGGRSDVEIMVEPGDLVPSQKFRPAAIIQTTINAQCRKLWCHPFWEEIILINYSKVVSKFCLQIVNHYLFVFVLFI
jgi:hypothetical protein